MSVVVHSGQRDLCLVEIQTVGVVCKQTCLSWLVGSLSVLMDPLSSLLELLKWWLVNFVYKGAIAWLNFTLILVQEHTEVLGVLLLWAYWLRLARLNTIPPSAVFLASQSLWLLILIVLLLLDWLGPGQVLDLGGCWATLNHTEFLLELFILSAQLSYGFVLLHLDTSLLQRRLPLIQYS